VAGLETILKAADLIADVRKAFSKIENLEQGQRQLADAVAALDRRLREQEASLREARAEIRLDAVKETQAIVNGVQGQLYNELRSLAVSVDRLGRAASAEPRLVSNAAGAGDGKASDGGVTPG
jgi:predicted RNase H-like nuclease (RuvC/YqgF family)